MISLEPEIEIEFLRFQAQLDVVFPLHDAKYLNAHDVLRAHFQIANHFYIQGFGLGGIGPKDMNLLESAVNRQFVSFGNKNKWDSLFDICATVFYGLIKNHPFHDANKRTAVLSVLYQLYKSGWCPTVNEMEIENFTVDVAENSLNKFKRFSELLKNKENDPEVKYISWYFKKNSRKIDNSPKAVTYRELKAILIRYGYSMENSSGNYIDIIKKTKKIEEKRFLGFVVSSPRTIEIEERIGQVGFPSWTAQVRPSALKSVREMTKLTYKHGVDSGAFYRGLDPMQSLITTYSNLLMRLADR